MASDDDSAMKAYAYVYRYDGLGECIWKRLPGCSPVTMQYDVHRRMVLSQDGNQALSGEWSCIWYDGLGRPCVMASCPSADYGDVSGIGFTASYRGSSGRTFGYVLSPELPDGAELRQVMYYDGYDFIDLSPESCRDSLRAYVSAFPVHPLPPARPADVLSDKDSTFLTPLPIPSVRVSKYDRYGRGRVTGGVMWSSDPGLPAMYSSVYYDDRGLVVQSRSQNHLGGWETEKTWYSFTGQPVKRTLSHSVGAIGTVPADSRPDQAIGDNPVVESYAWTYDNMDRPLKITHRLGSGAETVLADNRYDNLGRLSSDGRNGAEPIRTAYSYNIRSWQTGVSSGVFSEELHYTDPSACGASSAPQFNGSISSSVWSLSGGLRKGYGYSYDGLGRVTGAEWLLGGRPASGYGTSYSYDSHGNILSLSRERGSVPDGGDDLMMAYSGNRLHAMSDHGGSMIPDHLAGSIPSGMTQYAYDANGNMTRDLNSGLTVMSYNRLHLLDELTCVGSDGVRSIRYLYASDGRKLRVSTSGPGGSSSVTDYASNVVYRDGSLDRILIPGGYMTDGSYRFFMTDHLGSIRAVTDASGNVLHTYDYYPYGEDIAESASAVSLSAQECSSGTLSSEPENGSSSTAGASLQPYRFNGKESQEFAGLPYLDYGARYYHPLSSRWTTMDPMAEKYYSVSPYAFCSNNPVNFVDWDGDFPLVANLVGGIASVAVDYTGQVIANVVHDKEVSTSAFLNVDVGDMAISFGEGFVTGGGNIVKKVATKVAVAVVSEVARNAVDVKVGNGVTLEVNSVLETTVNTVVGVTAGSFTPSIKVKPLKTPSPNTAVSSVRAKAHANGKGLSTKEAKSVSQKTRSDNEVKKVVNNIVSDKINNAVVNVPSSVVKKAFEED